MTQEEFDELWNTIVCVEASIIVSENPQIIFVDSLKQEIFYEYKELMDHCKRHYMKFSDKYVDRHKVAASIMIGILKYTPLKVIGEIYYSSPETKPACNEHLAITVGLSILRAFIETELKKSDADEKFLESSLLKIQNGIVFPKVKHGNYRNNWANELYYTRKEGNYNLLAIAHELFFLEQNTLS